MMLHQKEKETAEPQTEAASSVEMEQPAIIAPERALIIDAIRTYQQPTPAYVFGQQCQNLRSERNIDLPNRRINQLLSEAKKYGIVIQEADSKFVFINDSKKIDKFLTAG